MRVRQVGPLLRAGFVMISVGIVVSGVTYAALQSNNVSLTNNSIETGTAQLEIGPNGSLFGGSMSGFSFTNVIPGGLPAPVSGNTFYLRNSGAVALALKLYVVNAPSNIAAVDLAKVSIVLTQMPSGSPQSFTISALSAAAGSSGLAVGDTLQPGASAQYKIQASMAADAYTGSGGAPIGNLNLAFSGIGVN